ncbi:cytochrome C [Comamonas serinivorans]|uniref:Cytochrome C n=1 Tax=Comamonas serinivorans TaxID=1082851 RepID=A0A1Y0ENI6_9BURK|nr:c-type cytochrome [Comamonas serinivorans]ARU05010.1 cytochrome C [Comamonas serinivorans]
MRHQRGLRFFSSVLAAAAVCLAASAALLGSVQAQTPSASPTFEDSMAQRMQACTACHGLQGRAGPDGYYPRLAGKPAGYLYHQLKNFQDGRRHYGLMADLVEPLSDAYLLEIARYFAQLDVVYPPPAERASQVDAQLLARGEQLVRQGKPGAGVPACMQCHGEQLMGIAPNTPALLGLPKAYLVGQLGAWRTGQRRALAPDCMARVVHELTDEDLHAAASWLAVQAVPAGAKPAAAVRGPLVPAYRCGAAPDLQAP